MTKVKMLPESSFRPGQSEETVELLLALSKARGEFDPLKQSGSIKRGGKVTRYAKFDDIVATVRGKLVENNLELIYQEWIDDNSNPLLLTYLVHTKSGQWICSKKLMDKNFGQDYGSDSTYQKRYSSVTITGVHGVDDDDDGQAKYERDEKKKDWSEYPLATWHLEEVNKYLIGRPNLREKVCKATGVQKIEDIKQKNYQSVIKFLKDSTR